LYLILYRNERYNWYKVGITNRDVEVRAKELQRSIRSSENHHFTELEIVDCVSFDFGKDAEILEKSFSEMNEIRFIVEDKYNIDGKDEFYTPDVLHHWNSIVVI